MIKVISASSVYRIYTFQVKRGDNTMKVDFCQPVEFDEMVYNLDLFQQGLRQDDETNVLHQKITGVLNLNSGSEYHLYYSPKVVLSSTVRYSDTIIDSDEKTHYHVHYTDTTKGTVVFLWYVFDMPDGRTFVRCTDALGVSTHLKAGKLALLRSDAKNVSFYTKTLHEAMQLMAEIEVKSAVGVSYPKSYRDFLYVCGDPAPVSGYPYTQIPKVDAFQKFGESFWDCKHGPLVCEDWTYKHLTQESFYKATESIKSANQNLITSIVEVINMLLEIKRGNLRLGDMMPDSLASAWLQYRYVYNTTKMDFEEALEFVKWSKIMDFSDEVTLHGVSYQDNITCHCKVKCHYAELGALKHAWNTLYTYGLQPNFYVVWDMTPYSFILDWFLPVGENLQIIDRQNYLSENFVFDCIVYSFSYAEEIGFNNGCFNIHYYARWIAPRPPFLEFAYLHDEKGPSTKTKLFRAMDSVAMIFGRGK